MQIRVSKLRDKLSLIQSLVPKKPALEIISNVLVKDGELAGTDLESRVSIRLEEANGANLLLPYRSVMEFLKYVPGDETVIVESQDKKVSFSWENGNATFEMKNVEYYPKLNLKDPSSCSLIDGDRLIEALMAAVKYCTTDGAKPVLSGVTLYLGNVLQVAASDGFRLSYQSLNLSYLNPITKIIVIPVGTIAILEELWKKEPGQVGLSGDLISQITAKRQLEMSLYPEKEVISTMVMKFGNVTLASRLIMGNPPDHLSLLAKFKEPNKALFMGQDLYNAVRRVSGVAKESTGIVRMVWDETQMTVSSSSGGTGSKVKVEANVPVQSGSIPGRIAINVSYLLDYLADKTGIVVMGKSEDSGAPALFHYGKEPIVALMPMAVKWEDDKPATGKPADTGNNSKKPSEKEPVGAGVARPAKESVKSREKSKHSGGRKKKSA